MWRIGDLLQAPKITDAATVQQSPILRVHLLSNNSVVCSVSCFENLSSNDNGNKVGEAATASRSTEAAPAYPSR